MVPLASLGRSGASFTRLGLGTWAIGGPWLFGWGPVDDAESIGAIRAAVEAGINWIDTAPVYGHRARRGGRPARTERVCTGPRRVRVHEVRPANAPRRQPVRRSAPENRSAPIVKRASGGSRSSGSTCFRSTGPMWTAGRLSRTRGRRWPSWSTRARCAGSVSRTSTASGSSAARRSAMSTHFNRRSRSSSEER